MQIMDLGRSPRKPKETNEEESAAGQDEPPLFDIQRTLKKAMTKMLEESLELTQKSSIEALEAKKISNMKRRVESNEKYEKVVQKQEQLLKKFSLQELQIKSRKSTPPSASMKKRFISTKILPSKNSIPTITVRASNDYSNGLPNIAENDFRSHS